MAWPGVVGVLTVVLGLLAAPLAAEAQPAGKVYRIGYLSLRSSTSLENVFLQGLRDLGWVEARTS